MAAGQRPQPTAALHTPRQFVAALHPISGTLPGLPPFSQPTPFAALQTLAGARVGDACLSTKSRGLRAHARTYGPAATRPSEQSHGMVCTPPTMGYSRTRTSPRAGGALLLADLAQ